MTKVEVLQTKAKQIRKNIIEMLGHAKSGHPGGSLDLAEIMAVLYFAEMKYDFSQPQWAERDYFILSKGHAAPALYGVLAEGGIISPAELLTLDNWAAVYRGILIRKNYPEWKPPPVLWDKASPLPAVLP